MRLGRRRKKKEKQRAAWDAVAATLETPPPVSTDDLPVAPAAVAAMPAPAAPASAEDSAFAPVAPVTSAPLTSELVSSEPVTPEPAMPAPAAAAVPPAPVPVASEPVVDAPVPSAPPPTDAPVLAASGPPPPAGPPVFRFTPTGAAEVPTAAPPTPPAPPAPSPPVAPVPPLTLVPDPEPAPSPGLATAPPLPPTAPVADVTSASPPEPIPDAINEAPPVAPSRAPDPHSTLPVVVAPPSHVPTPAAPAPAGLPAPTGRIVTVPHSTRAVAERMRDALDEMAQLSMRMDAWMDQAVEMRTQLLSEWDDDTLRPSYTDFVVRAVARALVQHPELNAVVRGDSIELLPRVHVGITLPGRDGIDIPVVRDADRRTLRTIAAASLGIDDAIVGPRSLPGPTGAHGSDGVAWRAPDNQSPAAMHAGGAAAVGDSALDTDVDIDAPASFVVASLGIYGVDAFTPIVMTPNVATLAIGRVRDATRWEGDRPTRASAMTLTLAWDHRAVDGTTAAEFLAEVRDILEQPYRLLVD